MRVPRYWRNLPFIYRLSGWRCVECGAFHPVKPIVCSRCRSRESQEAELPKTGRLIAYTVLRSPPKGYEEQAPYIVGLVELDDGTRLISQIVDVSEDELKEDMRVEAVFRRLRSNDERDVIEYGYKFRPVID